MTEKGFYHPDRGYWQTMSEPSAEVLASYPEGTIEVPLQPSGEHQWIDGAWVHAPDIDLQIEAAPDDLTGGPTLADIFGASVT